MTDRPILFSGPMVSALLDGRKTQTRRVIKAQPRGPLKAGDRVYPGLPGGYQVGDTIWPISPGFSVISNRPGPHPDWVKQHVKITVGDRLYVREAWRTHYSWDAVAPRDLIPGAPIQYEAGPMGFPMPGGRFRQAMHMPKWASRLTLIVTDVRVQRLQDISSADAVAEGVRSRLPDNDIAVSEFMDLWNSLNASRGFGWEANPWVVAITFDVIKQNIDQVRP